MWRFVAVVMVAEVSGLCGLYGCHGLFCVGRWVGVDCGAGRRVGGYIL
jgi:hypothetical protein